MISLSFFWELSAQVDAPQRMLTQVQKTAPDSNRIILLNNLGNYYLTKPGEFKDDLDSAMNFFFIAKHLGDSLRLPVYQNETLKLMGACYLEGSDVINGRKSFLQVIEYYQKVGDKRNEALTWNRMALCMPPQNDKANDYEHARFLYQQIHDTLEEIYSLKNVADVHLNQGKLILAETELHQVLEKYKAVHYPKLQDTYDLLAVVNRLKGNLDKALFYNLEAIKFMEATGNTRSSFIFYWRLGQTYQDLKIYDKSMAAFTKALTAFLQLNIQRDWGYLCRLEIVKALIAQKKPAKGIAFLEEAVIKYPPSSLRQRTYIARGLADCYKALHLYIKAEQYYLQMIALSDRYYGMWGTDMASHASNYINISDFFIQSRQFNKADYYLKKIFEFPSGIVDINLLSQANMMMFQVDSAKGNYIMAISHFREHKKLTDSIFNTAKSKQIEELQIQYEIEQKNKNIELQSKNILLLTNQTQLQQTQVKQSSFVRNAVIAGAMLLLILMAVGYSRYRLKQQKNMQLEVKQKEITAKNIRLEHLLKENEWLLREVHHRVKNNLQIVMSLLNSQSAYLQDEKALNAVMESQHRVQAMSLIHQKLYKSNNASSIYMPEYIRDLVEYLEDSFKTRNKIYFELQVDAISLDVLQAVPAGLILNEVITNSLKYAFPQQGNDTITIKLFHSPDNTISLLIADNGCGLPGNQREEVSSSFGMSLIKGLSEDLDGLITIDGQNGTAVSIVFPAAKMYVPGTTAF